MKKSTIVGYAFATVVLLFVLAAGYWALRQDVDPVAVTSPAVTALIAPEEFARGFLYGRITTVDGITYEGRLRWGGVEEALWIHYFNGAKTGNPWVAHVPPERLPKEGYPIEVFGLEIFHREHAIDVARLFMARFGDIARIDADGREVRVTLKSGTLFVLDRFEANDFDDGVRVWEGGRGAVDLDSVRIRAIEFLPGPGVGAGTNQLHGTVRTQQGNFTGFVQWNRTESVGTDELTGNSADGKLNLRFDTIRSITRRSPDSSLVTLLDGRDIVLSGTRDSGEGNLGIYIDDARYGRVLVSWEAFERITFSPGGSGPAYGDFPPGSALRGSIITRSGRRLAGRLVYDLDESEVTETLDAPSEGVDYTISFGLIASIVLPSPEGRDAQTAKVTLHSGEEIQLECAGDLGKGNAGMLVFVDGSESPDYLTWTEVDRVELERPPMMYPPFGRR